jgi:tRNA nucleotidyltransferase (CCA-adding enzyme)
VKDKLTVLKSFFGKDADKVFLVGGCVRDSLTGRPVKDVDLLTQLAPSALVKYGAKPVDPAVAFPVFSLYVDGLGRVEVALPRTEKKAGVGHTGFDVCTDVTLPVEVDLSRRDFTVNAMAVRVSDGLLFDPFNGQVDLTDNMLRHVTAAFKDDSLRVYRGLRFTCRGFTLAPETLAMMQEMDVTEQPAERVYMELEKAMRSEYPERFFQNMLHLDRVMSAHFPEVKNMVGVTAGPNEFHKGLDVFSHSVNVLKRMKDKTVAGRLAAFFHDVGKVYTDPTVLPHHYEHEDRSAEVMVNVLKRLRAPASVRTKVVGAVKNHMRVHKLDEMRPGKVLRLAGEAVAGSYDKLLMELYRADSDHPNQKSCDLFSQAVAVSKMSSRELGFTPVDFADRAGLVVRDMVFQRRVEYFRKVSRVAK